MNILGMAYWPMFGKRRVVKYFVWLAAVLVLCAGVSPVSAGGAGAPQTGEKSRASRPRPNVAPDDPAYALGRKHARDMKWRRQMDSFVCQVHGSDITFSGFTGNLAGETHKDLVSCVEGSGLKFIDHLYITSRGGDAWRTLTFALAYKGRIHNVVVRGLCASSCANYIVPLAVNLVVEPRSYILLHGAISAKSEIQSIDKGQPTLAKSLEAKGVKPEAVADTLARARQNADLEQKVQDVFEAHYLSCPTWLHPGAVMEKADAHGLIVEKSMAAACLKRVVLKDYAPVIPAALPDIIKKAHFVLGGITN